MEESIKKIMQSTTLISVILIIITFILCTNTNIFMNPKQNSNNKEIGINSREININILDDKILCEDVIVFNRITQREIFYQFIQDNNYLSNVKVVYINNKNNFHSTTFNISLSKGRISLDEFLLNSLKITGNNDIDNENNISTEEIKLLITQSEKNGDINLMEKEIINKVFDFSDKISKEIIYKYDQINLLLQFKFDMQKSHS